MLLPNKPGSVSAVIPAPVVSLAPIHASSQTTTFYFCIPPNDNLLGYWDTVADRLFKLRNCMNIEGVARELPLFAPPIDPALLVQATAMGVDLSSALNDLNAATPHYRFSYLVQKAQELCAELKSLGGALLAALEKKDGESLTMLRATQETTLLNAVSDVKQLQVDEANTTLAGLQKSRQQTEIRYTFYQNIADRNVYETDQILELGVAQGFQEASQQLEIAASQAGQIPNATIGSSGWSSPVVTAQFGGLNIVAAYEAESRSMAIIASSHSHKANMAAILGGWARRSDEWRLQANLAAKELEQIDKQIAAAEIRVAIAEKELENHYKQIENASAVEDFLRSKHTNQELYTWMLSQVSTIFFQSYKLAYDMAKQAERAFRFERGLTSSNYIQFGYWDSLRKGLLSGERLSHDIRRMEVAYLDQNKREYEITKHVSLVLHDPMALITLKETGQCEVDLPESLFDADYPGHYMRRIKSLSLTIPCVVGPYTSINCTLTLLNNKTRIKSDAGGSYPENEDGDDARFVVNFAALQSIATSHAQNDSGMFELNFRDERYLPFEGAGAISRWRIELPKEYNAFDFDTLSDVVLHLKYTAREGGENLKDKAGKAVKNAIKGADNGNAPLARMFSAKREFPTEWYRFLQPTNPAAGGKLTFKLPIDMGRDRFPFPFRGKTATVRDLILFLKTKEGFTYDDNNKLLVHLSIDADSLGTQPFMQNGSPIKGLPFAKQSVDQIDIPFILMLEVQENDLPTNPSSDTSWWIKSQDSTRLNPAAIDDIWIVCGHSVQ